MRAEERRPERLPAGSVGELRSRPEERVEERRSENAPSDARRPARMRALAIAPQPFFTPRGTPFSVYYRTLVLAELGVGVDLLTYGQGDDVDIPGVRIVRIPAFRRLGPVKVGPSALKAFLDLFLAAWTVGLLLRHRYDFVDAHEESVFFCRFLRPLFGFKLVYDMHSILSQQLENFEFSSSRLLIGAFRRLEDACLRAADAVITISPHLAEYAVERVRDPRRHFLIENSIFDEVRLAGRDGEEEEDEEGRHGGKGRHGGEGGHGENEGPGGGDRHGGEGGERDEDGAPGGDTPRAGPPDRRAPGSVAELFAGIADGRPVILYAGTFEPYQGLDLLIRAFARVQQQRPEAFLLLLGGAPEQVARYRGLAEAEGVAAHCRFAGRVPQPLARAATRRADVLTSPRSSGSNTPLKIYEQLASGRPLVATRIAAHTQVLDDEVCFLVEPEPEPMAEELLRALDGDGVERRTAAARRLHEERYSRRAYVDKMRGLLRVLG